jgi:hypothetical protein
MLEQTIRGTESGLSERLPTPTASDYKDQPTSKSWKEKGAINFKLSNPEIRAKWPTPTAHMAKETNAPSEANRNEPSMASRVGGKLNPTWVEWLMGWPLGWTDLKPLEMGKSPCVQPQLSKS